MNSGDDVKIPEDLLLELKQTAKKAVETSYSPYSEFPVGAAVASADGRIFQGANVENASYGLTVCAERTAVFEAVLAGATPLVAIVIFTPTEVPTAPCGSCRQVLREFAANAIVISFCDGVEELCLTVDELLPHSFGPEALQVAGTPKGVKSGIMEGGRRMCIDIDNVVAQTDQVMRSVIGDVTDGRVSLSYEDVQRFNYWECRDQNDQALTKEEWRVVHDRFSEPDNVRAIKPVEGAQECLRRLSDKFTLHFATSRLPKARRATLEWLDDHGFPEHDIHFLKHGEKHISLGAFAVSVEDDLDQALAFASAGFGMNFVIAHPWNAALAQSANVCRVSGWKAIERKLIGDNQ